MGAGGAGGSGIGSGKQRGLGQGSANGACPAVTRRLERLRADGECLVKEIENLYDMAILRLPLELRQMNWLEYYGAECRGLLGWGSAVPWDNNAGGINNK